MVLAPEGRPSLARGASPWNQDHNSAEAPEGRQNSRAASVALRGWVLSGRWSQGLAPLANDSRPSGAPNGTATRVTCNSYFSGAANTCTQYRSPASFFATASPTSV